MAFPGGRPNRWIEPRAYWNDKPYANRENHGPRRGLPAYHGGLHPPPRFELYQIASDPDESRNLADDPAHAATLLRYQQKLKALQNEFGDPWITKWDYE